MLENNEKVEEKKNLEGYVPADYIEMLTDRVFKGVMKYLTVVLGVLAVIIGIFGYDYKNAMKEIKDKIEKDGAVIANQKVENQQTIADLRAKGDNANDSVKRAEKAAESMQNLPIIIGEKISQIEKSQNDLLDQLERSQRATRLAQEAAQYYQRDLGQVKRWRYEQEQEQDKFRTDLLDSTGDFEEDMRKRMRHLEGQLGERLRQTDSTILTVNKKIEEINSEVFESTTVQLREKSVTKVSFLPEGGNTANGGLELIFYIKVGIIEDHQKSGKRLKLYDLAILDSDERILCKQTEHVTQGDKIRFSYKGYFINVLINYGIDLNWAKDYVQAQVRWRKLKTGEQVACGLMNPLQEGIERIASKSEANQ